MIHLESFTLTTTQVSDRLQAAIDLLTQIHNEHALEIATCARLMQEKDSRIAWLEAQTIELVNLRSNDAHPAHILCGACGASDDTGGCECRQERQE